MVGVGGVRRGEYGGELDLVRRFCGGAAPGTKPGVHRLGKESILAGKQEERACPRGRPVCRRISF